MGGEQSKLGVALTKDARRKMKRSKNRAQANTPTHADTGVAGSVSLSDASLCGTAVKKKQKTGKKRKRNTCSSADTTRKSRASDAAVGTAEESQLALEGANHATSTSPGSKPKKAAKRKRLRSVLIEEAMRREKLSAKTGQV